MKVMECLFNGYKEGNAARLQPSAALVELRKMSEEQYVCLHQSIPQDLLRDVEMYSAMMHDLIAQYRKEAFETGVAVGMQLVAEMQEVTGND